LPRPAPSLCPPAAGAQDRPGRYLGPTPEQKRSFGLPASGAQFMRILFFGPGHEARVVANKNCRTTATGNTLIGAATETAGSSATSVKVRLNGTMTIVG
jgi:hypothetical protein